MKKNTYYDETQWPYYRELINKRIIQYYNKIILDNNGKQVQADIDACQAAHEKYYNEFEWTLYKTLKFFSVFLVLLIIPAYSVIKKLLAMTKEKNFLQEDYETKNAKRIAGITKIIDATNFTDMINLCLTEINYEHKGPIPPNFLQVMKKYFPKYKNDWIINNELRSTDSSSWGVFNKKVVVINMAKKTCYVGSSFESVLIYEHKYCPMMMMTKAEDLSFKSSFDATSNYLKDIHKKWKHTKLENAIFNTEYPIVRNNEVDFRIFYTVSVQEYLASQLTKYGQAINVPGYYWWNKKGPFVYSNHEMTTPFYDFNRNQFKFIDDIKFELNEILNICAKMIRKIVFDRYLSLNCITAFPVMMTENQKDIIHDLELGMIPTLTVTAGDDVYAQCVLSMIWNQPIIKKSVGAMYIPKTLTKEQLSNGLIITTVLVDAHYYRLLDSRGNEYVSGSMQDRRYFSYKSGQQSFYLYYLPYKTFAIYDNENSDIGELQNIFIKYNMQKRVKIKDDHIVFTCANNSEYEKIKELTILIDEYFKNKNSEIK